MPGETRTRLPEARKTKGRFARWIVRGLWPNQRLRWTREGVIYLLFWLGLMAMGLHQQINLILLVAGLAAGPVVASILVSASMLRRLQVSRRVPAYVFSGETLRLEYNLQNNRLWTAALALHVGDEIVAVDRTVSGSALVLPDVFFPRVAGQGRSRIVWEGASPTRGRYEFRSLEVATRSPFGLLERRLTLDQTDSLIVYPKVGQLTRRWHLTQREASETRRGRRHDRSMQQQEYHGLRDYRPGDTPRWIHWRTSARLGRPMVKEFEQQHEQDIAVLIDPWLPRTKVTPEQRQTLEELISFAATVCYDSCRQTGRRLLLGWTGPIPGMRQGPASVKLLHEVLEQLAVLRPATEGGLAALLDAMPTVMIRESLLVVISTRPVNLIDEAEKTARLGGTSARSLMGRITFLDASRGDLVDLIKFEDHPDGLGHRRADPEEDSTRSGERYLERPSTPKTVMPGSARPHSEATL